MNYFFQFLLFKLLSYHVLVYLRAQRNNAIYDFFLKVDNKETTLQPTTKSNSVLNNGPKISSDQILCFIATNDKAKQQSVTTRQSNLWPVRLKHNGQTICQQLLCMNTTQADPRNTKLRDHQQHNQLTNKPRFTSSRQVNIKSHHG